MTCSMRFKALSIHLFIECLGLRTHKQPQNEEVLLPPSTGLTRCSCDPYHDLFDRGD